MLPAALAVSHAARGAEQLAKRAIDWDVRFKCRKTDLGEMVNQAENPKFRDVLRRHRAFLREFSERYNDAAAMRMLLHVEASNDGKGSESGGRDS